MAPVVLKEFILPCDIDTFLKCFWLDSAWYERFLVEKLEDINVTVGEWAPAQEAVGFIRSVRSAHPSKLSFPGLPTHAESLKTHIYQLVDSGNYLTVSIKESNTFRGIPYADYFGVNTEWVVMSQNKASSSFAALSAATSSGARGTSNSSSSNVSSGTVGSAGSGGVGGGTGECSVKIMLDIVFHKHTWLQGTIEANTKAELLDVYELWQVCDWRLVPLLTLRVSRLMPTCPLSRSPSVAALMTRADAVGRGRAPVHAATAGPGGPGGSRRRRHGARAAQRARPQPGDARGRVRGRVGLDVVVHAARPLPPRHAAPAHPGHVPELHGLVAHGGGPGTVPAPPRRQ
jgi:hypothetical protein